MKNRRIFYPLSFLLILVFIITAKTVSADADVALNSSNFPDNTFLTYVSNNFDTNQDGQLSSSEISSVKQMEVPNGKGITSLQGIEFFTSLEKLICMSNSVAELDLSKNTKLTYLDLWCTGLRKLDVSKNTLLTYLACRANNLASLNVSNNTALTHLDCGANELVSLNVSNNTALTFLDCGSNHLTTLDVSKNTTLTQLYCGSNLLTTLSLTANTKLTDLDCDENHLSKLNISKNTKLTYLDCDDNEFTSLDVSKNTALTELSCTSNKLSELDISSNPLLTDLYCYGNNLVELDITNNPKLILVYEDGRPEYDDLDLAPDYTIYHSYVGTDDEDEEYSLGFDNIAEIYTSPFSFAVRPTYATAAVGDVAQFRVKTNRSTAVYSWYCRNSTSDSWQLYQGPSTSGYVSVCNVTVTEASNGQQYQCRVSSCGSTLTSSAVTLYVSPKITTQPKSVITSIGSEVNITVKATGPSLKYQWYYRNSLTGEWKASTVESGTTATYNFIAKESYNGRMFYCVVSNGNRSVKTNVVALTVGPVITTQPVSKKVAAGNSVSFTVVAEGTGLKYQWYYRNSSSDSWKASSSSSSKTNKYTATASEAATGRQFRCKVTGSNGGYVYTNVVTLTVTPKITTQPTNKTAKVGTTVTYTVAANGTGLTYRWYYKTPSSDEWKASTLASGKTAEFSFTANESYSGRQYRCLVKNSYGTSVYTNTVKLTVVPRIVAQPVSKTVAEGKTASFSVEAEGTNLTYQWYYRKSSSDEWHVSSASSAKTAILKVTAKAAYNGYQYRCGVSNKNGTTYTNAAKLTVK